MVNDGGKGRNTIVYMTQGEKKKEKNVLIENVLGYVFLGQHYSLKENNQAKEIQRRIMAGWAAYAKHRDIFKSNLAICLNRHVYNSCVLPAMPYGAETWARIHESVIRRYDRS